MLALSSGFILHTADVVLPWLTDVAGVLATTVDVKEKGDDEAEEAEELGECSLSTCASFDNGAGIVGVGGFRE